MLQKPPHDLSGTSEYLLQDCHILIVALEKNIHKKKLLCQHYEERWEQFKGQNR